MALVRTLGILSLSLIVTGCATTQNANLRESANSASERMTALFGEEMLCDYEQATGSRRVQLVCRFAQDVELERELAQEYARRRHTPDT